MHWCGQKNCKKKGDKVEVRAEHLAPRAQGADRVRDERQLRVRFGGSKQRDTVGIAVNGFGDWIELASIS